MIADDGGEDVSALREFGFVRDRSFYESRPSTTSRIKVHRESVLEPEMAACDSRWILLDMNSPWDIAKTRSDCPTILCRRCYPR